MSTIYSKVTYTRKIEYQTETRIVDNDGIFSVIKSSLYSNNHLDNMYSNYLKLKEIYNDNIVSCTKDNNKLLFPFVQGNSLEDLINNGNIDLAINHYLSLLDNKDNIIDFEMTEEFENVFGHIDYQGKACKLSNIDLIFSNIIVDKNNNPIILDYEWVFDFPIPRDFVIYRAVEHYALNHAIDKEILYKKLNAKVLPIFKNMNDAFTKMVENNYLCNYQKNEHYVFNAIDNANAEISRLNDRVNELGSWGNSLNEEIKDRDSKIEYFINENDNLSLQIEKYSEENKKILNENNELKDEINTCLGKISSLNSNIENLNFNNDQLMNELSQIKNSTTYKLSLKYFKVRDFFFPPNSKRKLFVKMFFKALRHPIWFIKHMTPSNIKKFKKYSKSEGVERVLERVNVYQENNTEINYSKSLDLFDMKPRSEYKTLELPNVNNPLVSIIIPVYNQFSYTYGCIESIIKNTKGIDYEVIIGDDCSTDETVHISKYVKNIKVNKNKVNTRFLLNCNNAAKIAKGKYLYFLNNDTNVQPGWLESLIETINTYPNAGMVGSKLVYPTGQLQEAGGILWRDASAWNYGNKSDPETSEYNYRKPVDYISGAAIMISKKLWDEIGGFDETFCPAYCEDSDLAFEVRKRGYEVIYDPFSVVIHYEGVSNGTDTSSGIKKYQIDNTKKFYNKWKDVLLNHYPNAENVFTARDRSYNKKTILVIDHYVPQYDKDAGSRTVFGYLKILSELGYNVKFLGENFYRHEPYTKELQKMGIEVLYGPYYANNYQNWLKQNGNYFDYVFFNRPHITNKFIDVVIDNCKNAKLIYYGHDLHYLRINREYELKHDDALLKESDKWKKIELDIFNKVDLIYYPSKIEVEEIKKINNSLNVKVLQPYLYSNISSNYNAYKRDGILFVGGFRHSPNFDGIMWFINEIMPNIINLNKNIKLYVAGSYPPQELIDSANKNIIVKGFVSDAELDDLYNSVKMVVAPLRFGAGIKGKVVEAMSKGVPVYTTICGAEGIDCESLIVDDTFNDLVDIYLDNEKLNELSNNLISYVKDNYSEESAKERFSDEMKKM